MTTWSCNSAGHPHDTYAEAQACDLEAHRKQLSEYLAANARAEREREEAERQKGKK